MTDQNASEQGGPLFQLFNEVGIIAQLATTRFEKVMPRGMTLAQFSVLNHFVRLKHESRAPHELARAFQVTKATMTSTLQKLEAKGLIDIKGDPEDGRAKRVRITEEGIATRNLCLANLKPALSRVAINLRPELLSQLLPQLVEVRQIMDQDRS